MSANQPSALVPSAFEQFGDLLRFLRRRAQLTQRDLGIAVGYNFAHISRLEAGQRSPDPTAVAAVFVPALHLANAPEWAERLIALASSGAKPPIPDLPSATAVLSQTPTLSAAPLLATRLAAPRTRHDVVARPRLLRLLDRAWSVPLALLSAPAGFGKTTLLTQWVASWPEGTAVAWLTLDAGDNTVITWVHYLVAACQRARCRIWHAGNAWIAAPTRLCRWPGCRHTAM